jgi:hypothetical protein
MKLNQRRSCPRLRGAAPSLSPTAVSKLASVESVAVHDIKSLAIADPNSTTPLFPVPCRTVEFPQPTLGDVDEGDVWLKTSKSAETISRWFAKMVSAEEERHRDFKNWSSLPDSAMGAITAELRDVEATGDRELPASRP